MRRILPLLEKPGRYLGAEHGAVIKNPAEVEVRAALAFPDLFEIGMSYLGSVILADCINKTPEFWAERAFAPTKATAEIMREKGILLGTHESGTPLKDMDLVGFSLTHELCYTNVLFMLDLAGIPLWTKDRSDTFPLIVAGGGCTFNAEPVADFFDCMVLGDGEDILPRMLGIIRDAKASEAAKHEVLLQLKDLPGVYVPSFFEDMGPGKALKPLIPGYARVEKAILPDLDASPLPTERPVPFSESVHDRLTVEIARGCTRGCRFCQAGMIYRPVRERSNASVLEGIEKGLDATGYEEVSFLSLSTGDYSALEGLFEGVMPACKARQTSVSLPSLRVGSVSPEIMKSLSGLRRTGVTLAPEAGSQRLRDVINKGVDEESLLRHVAALKNHGWRSVKLYFMMGLPTESDEDLAAIIDLARRVRDVPGAVGKDFQVTASVSPFVPKPHTPFQWEAAIDMDEIRRRVGVLLDKVRGQKRITLKWHMPEMSRLENVFSRGDRALAPAVAEAYTRGALFCSWKDQLDLALWEDIFKDLGIDSASYLRERCEDELLPWDHLTSGVSKNYLQTERRRALRGAISRDCRYHVCRACGVCNMDGRPCELVKQAETMDIRPRLVHEQPDRKEFVEEVDEQVGKRRVKPGKPDLGPLAEKAMHLRIRHKKIGQAVWLSQTELTKTLERAMRRAEIPVSFSQGYHPMPRLSFGRALPVGVAGLDEWFTLYLYKPMHPELVAESLGRQMPRGLRIMAVDTLSMSKKQPDTLAEDFYLHFGTEARKQQARAAAFLEQDELHYTWTSKKGEKTVDVRPLVAHAEAWGRGILLRSDMRRGYLGPMKLIAALFPDYDPMQLHIIKLRQHEEFPEEDLQTSLGPHPLQRRKRRKRREAERGAAITAL
jgi:radical SAM family uncharacterized protein/radical SAM-linked protein